MDDAARVEALEAENQRLQDRVLQLEEAVGFRVPWLAPPTWRLTGSETRIIGALLARELCTKDTLMAALYVPGADDEPQIKIVDVFICKIRRKLKPFGISIETHWGQGYRLDAANKDKIRAAIAEWNAGEEAAAA